MRALFRCDATAEIGFGHLSRCLALAEAFRPEGVACTFAGRFDAAAVTKVEQAGFALAVLDAEVNTGPEGWAGDAHDLIVVDSYRTDADYLAALKASGAAVLLIDDFATLSAYPCDAVLNFTWAADGLPYPPDPLLLLGPHYLPVRRPLVAARPASIERERAGAVRALLVAVGGSDPKQIAARLLRVLATVENDVCVRVISAAGDDLTSLLQPFAEGSEVLAPLPDLAAPLAWADAALTGGGLLKYECAFMGVPVAAIAQNEGQDGETQGLARGGLVFDLGLADEVGDDDLATRLGSFLGDADLRGTMAARMRDSFPPDPPAHAARAILEALRH